MKIVANQEAAIKAQRNGALGNEPPPTARQARGRVEAPPPENVTHVALIRIKVTISGAAPQRKQQAGMTVDVEAKVEALLSMGFPRVREKQVGKFVSTKAKKRKGARSAPAGAQ